MTPAALKSFSCTLKNYLLSQALVYYITKTLGNWSSDELFGTTEIPYVTSLPEFPTTKQNIFRDFPDVFNEEYEETAKKY